MSDERDHDQETLLFSLAYMVETTDRRLTKAGYASGVAERVRRDRSTKARTTATAKRQAKIAARRARRRPASIQR